MPTPLPRFFKHRVFFVYWALILALGGYLAYDYCTDYYAELEPVLKNTVAQGVASAERLNDYRLTEIHKYADAYKMEYNEQLRRKAKAAIGQAQTCKNRIRTLKLTPSRSSADIEQLADLLRQLGDSLFLYIDRDTFLIAKLQVLVLQPAAALKTSEIAALFQRVQTSKLELYLIDLEWKMTIAVEVVLTYLLDNINTSSYPFDGTFILVNTDSCAQSGQPISGQVSLRGYSTCAENLTCFVDDCPYLFSNGLVTYDSIYQIPGIYRQSLKIQVVNPLTNDSVFYFDESEFSIQKL